MKNKVLIALMVGSFCNRTHAMEQSLLEQLQKDADQLTAESIELMDDINEYGDQEIAALKRNINGNQELASAQNADSTIDISVCWRELWKKVGALEHLSKHSIFPKEGTHDSMQISFNALNEAYKLHLEREQYSRAASLQAAADAQNNQK